MKFLFLFVIFLVTAQSAYGKIFTRCKLARELKRQGFPANQLRNWVCLVEGESNRNTASIGGRYSNGAYDWGLFQINDYFSCKIGSKGGYCNVNCYDVVTDDITIASSCAKLIYKRYGFTAWYGWLAHCQGQPLPDLSSCGVL